MSPNSQHNELEAVLETSQYYPRVRLKRNVRVNVYLAVKRLVDIIGATVGLVMLSPLFLLIGILIKLEDPKGPVFFKQVRIGKNERSFSMFKFRSMVSDAEKLLDQLLVKNEMNGAMFKMRNDPRVTRVGRFIRKTSIDELPQLWNVLKGEMSLVGPRPPLPREVADYSAYDKKRLSVTPGCTGLWQVSGRSELSFQEMVELDLYYIRKRSIWFDLFIVLKTIYVMVRSKNAY